MQSQKESSDTYKFFKTIYPEPGVVEHNIQSKVDDIKTNLIRLVEQSKIVQYSEFFKLSEIDDIFSDALIYLNNFERKFNMFELIQPSTFIYLHRKIRYLGTIYIDNFENHLGQSIRNLNIKLSNDGFVYTNKVNAFRENIERHSSKTWCLLDREYNDEFDSILKWCKKKLNCKSRVKIFYNFKEERLDIKVFGNNKRTITITFEPGYPEIDFDDEWFEGFEI